MRERFQDFRFRPESLRLIEVMNEIVRDYQQQDLKLTLRQLYYQCVSRNIIPNTDRSYKNLGSLLNDARLAGMVDWAAIEDRVRVPRSTADWPDIAALAEDAARQYRLPRWKGQTYYAELWVEKDALAGVLTPIARDYHVTLMVNRGYSSATAMYESARRFIRACQMTGEEHDAEERPEVLSTANYEGDLVHLVRKPKLFYLGDHDPSGEDMVRDVRERLSTFGIEVEVQKVALTTAQVREYNPPPNPAKMSDSRAQAYVAKHGRVSWEVDALPPEVLNKIVRRALRGIVNKPLMDAIKEQEKLDKRRLRDAAKALIEEAVANTDDEPVEPNDKPDGES
jgi:hypothetical protein